MKTSFYARNANLFADEIINMKTFSAMVEEAKEKRIVQEFVKKYNVPTQVTVTLEEVGILASLATIIENTVVVGKAVVS